MIDNVMEIMSADFSKIIELSNANLKYLPTVFNVSGYGAKGNGTTDDTAAIQATIDYAISVGGKAVFFPHGTYKVTTLTSLSSVVLFGDNASFVGISNTITQIGAPITSGIVYNVKEYGAKGDGSDDTAAIQATIDACGAAGGGVVFFPPGSYKITSTLLVKYNNIKLKGASEGASTLLITASFGDGIKFYSESTDLNAYNNYCSMENLNLWCSVDVSSGAWVKLSRCQTFSMSNVFGFNMFYGLYIESVIDSSFVDCMFKADDFFSGFKSNSSQLYIGKTSLSNFNSSALDFVNCKFGGHTNNKFLDNAAKINGIDGVFFTNCYFSFTKGAACLLLNGDTTTQVTGANFSNCWFDTCDGFGLRIFVGAGFTGKMGIHSVVNSHFHLCGTHIDITQSVLNTGPLLKVANCDFDNALANSVTITSGNGVILSDCSFTRVNSTNNFFACIKIFQATNILINGVSYMQSTTEIPEYMISIENAAANNIVISNVIANNVKNGQEIAFSNSSNANNIKVSNCITNNAVSTVAIGTTFFPSLASDLFTITGTGTVTTISPSFSFPGRQITLFFTGAATVANGTAIKLAGAVNFVATANDILRLVCIDGTNWAEVSRSVN